MHPRNGIGWTTPTDGLDPVTGENAQMTSTPRRPGFRLPWAAEGDDTTDPPAPGKAADVAAGSAKPVSSVPMGAPAAPAANAPTPQAPTEATSPEATKPSATPAVTQPAATPAATPSAATAAVTEPFLQDLVDAMRHVAEEARDKNISELKALVEKRVEQVGERSAERAEDLRRRSELDIKGIGDWERTELERVGAEAEGKVEARRKQLEQQLHDHQAGAERDVSNVRTRLADHQRELAAFFARLDEIKDPSAFVEAAKGMPAPPTLDSAVRAERPADAPADGESLTSRLAMLGIDKEQAAAPVSVNGSAAETPAASGAPSLEQRLAELDKQLEPVPDPATAAPAATTGEPGAGVSTAIVVKGLGSFGAITSFKQSLEKVEGIHSVTLSLGPTGEFVYRAAHDDALNLEGVIGSMEGGSAEFERETDGTLRVAVTRPR